MPLFPIDYGGKYRFFFKCIEAYLSRQGIEADFFCGIAYAKQVNTVFALTLPFREVVVWIRAYRSVCISYTGR